MAKKITITAPKSAATAKRNRESVLETNGKKKNASTPTATAAPKTKPAAAGKKNGAAGPSASLTAAAAPKAKPIAPKAAKSRGVTPKTRAPGRRSSPGKAATALSISNDDIALRAYFIAEKRHAEGRYDDPSADWIEAERQLRADAARLA